MWDQTSAVASLCRYACDWGEGKGNIPNSRGVASLNLTSPCITGSSGGRPVSASIAPVGVVQIAPVIPKHASLCVLLSLLLALAI